MIVLHCVVSCVCILQLISNINLTNKTSSCQSLPGQDGGPFKDLSRYIPCMLYCYGVGDPDPALLSIKPLLAAGDIVCIRSLTVQYMPWLTGVSMIATTFIRLLKCGASHLVSALYITRLLILKHPEQLNFLSNDKCGRTQCKQPCALCLFLHYHYIATIEDRPWMFGWRVVASVARLLPRAGQSILHSSSSEAAAREREEKSQVLTN